MNVNHLFISYKYNWPILFICLFCNHFLIKQFAENKNMAKITLPTQMVIRKPVMFIVQGGAFLSLCLVILT